MSSALMLERLRAVDWDCDWDRAFDRVGSRRVLFREYLRRAAVWARAYGAEEVWPFCDVTPYVDAEFELDLEVAGGLEELLRRLLNGEVGATCTGAVRLAELRLRNPAVGAGLPDLYEPLVLFYERGGAFFRDCSGSFLDLTGVMFKHGPLEGQLGGLPLSVLTPPVLDALDAEGRVTYYTAPDRPGPLLRRRVLRDERWDERLGPGLRWEPDRFDETVLTWIDELEAARLIGVGEGQCT
ncbi:hypothetical protein [Streptomyces sp. NBC_00091]|uniref:hypothetical protein n=1 Tax=Streptomyces sp. NBC_00091 TaxID=2975648 RepID=UPI00224D0BEE|nr:hypothetical protein [Streptomyces sp. NBC_00091]MCX5377634.1 hypothetical protein [Streptomyces sp. NBC_00091]